MAQSIQKIITVGIIEKNLSSINPPHNDMVQRSGCVYAGFSRHTIQISNTQDFVNRKSEERPLILVHFGVVMVLNLMIGLLTPPVGLVLYIISDIAGISFEQMVRVVMPFLIPLVVVLFLITYIPNITLIVPRMLGLI